MKRQFASRQQGMALLALLAVIMLGAAWFLVRQLNTESGGRSAVTRTRNAEVLNRAKLALIGYIAAQAVKAGENNPGALPCPEAAGYFDNPTQDGQTASSCTLPKVGRFPWRTMGTEKLVDASGEPLWYVVGPGWAYTGTPDWRNYLECENATSPADSIFVTSGPSGAFNDQVLRITVADIMPAIEAAIANRIEREIVPALNAVYGPGPAPAGWGFAGTKPVYPYAAQWVNGVTSPGPGAGTSSYLGVAGNYQGLLPFNQTNCTASASNPRCLPSLITWQGTPSPAVEIGFGYIGPGVQTCSWQSGGEVWECAGNYHEDDGTTLPVHVGNPANPIRLEMTATFNNVAMGLRAIDTTKMTVEARDDVALGPWQPQAVTYTATMNTNGSVTLTFGATMPNIDVMGWGSYAQFRIRIERTAVGDHALLDTANAVTGWFARNEWYRLAYYAVAAGHTAASLPPACTTGTNCLSVTNVAPAGAQRAILILGGRSVNGTPRPSTTLANYLESGNATGAFVRNTVSASVATPVAQRFNDRVVVIGSN